jgi:SAM-dependent methyltransferase
MFPGYDPDSLRQQYATDEALRIRQETHELYTVPKVDFPAWVVSLVDWRGDETLLDVGSGPGNYYPTFQSRWPDVGYTALDFSMGMMEKHPARGKIAQADAQFLPFPDQSFDVVMANHMLYHVPDIDQAISEFRRVLKPDGLLVAATNSMHTMPEFQALFRRAIVLLSATGNSQPPLPEHNPFSLENGTRRLSRHFYAVVRYDLPSTLVFSKSEPIIAYLESCRFFREPQLPADVSWDDLMMVMREQINRLLSHFGELVVNKVSGALIASDRGGFIHEYIEHVQENA